MLREGLLVVISGPSGTGKGTLLKLLREQNNNLRYSISVTTRQPRKEEVDGKNYFFRSITEFEEMIRQNELLEWDKYCDNYYGTPKSYIENTVKLGYDVVLEITVEGALNIKKNYPGCVLIFILPPSFEELERRICGRGTESADVIAKRLAQAKRELSFIENYDYLVVNDDLETAEGEINSILTAEKLRSDRNNNILTLFKQEVGIND